jgi:hypothetical protein
VLEDSLIIAVVDLPYTEGGPSCALLLRDQTGKYVWNAQLIYVPKSQKDATVKPAPSVPPTVEPFSVKYAMYFSYLMTLIF